MNGTELMSYLGEKERQKTSEGKKIKKIVRLPARANLTHRSAKHVCV